MSVTFRKAVRSKTMVLVALAGPSGCGKTYSALRLARGLVGPNGRVALIDTEACRALHYSDKFDFDHCDMSPPFSPDAYQHAIVEAEKQGYGAIIIDSMSHEWAGDGGCQDIHDEAHRKMGGADSTSVLAWRDAKLAHKKMISRLLQSRSHIIFCLRAEEKIKFSKSPQGKMQIEPAGWMPICEKNFMYEMTMSFLMLDKSPGVPVPIKLQEQMRAFVNLGKPIDESVGQKMSEWAEGHLGKPEAQGAGTDLIGVSGPPPQASDSAPPALLTDENWNLFLDYMDEDPERTAVGKQLKDLLKIAKVAALKGSARSGFVRQFQDSCRETGVPCEAWVA